MGRNILVQLQDRPLDMSDKPETIRMTYRGHYGTRRELPGRQAGVGRVYQGETYEVPVSVAETFSMAEWEVAPDTCSHRRRDGSKCNKARMKDSEKCEHHATEEALAKASK